MTSVIAKAHTSTSLPPRFDHCFEPIRFEPIQPSSPPPYENASVPELLVGMYNSCDDPYLLVGDQDTPRGVEVRAGGALCLIE